MVFQAALTITSCVSKLSVPIIYEHWEWRNLNLLHFQAFRKSSSSWLRSAQIPETLGNPSTRTLPHINRLWDTWRVSFADSKLDMPTLQRPSLPSRKTSAGTIRKVGRFAKSHVRAEESYNPYNPRVHCSTSSCPAPQTFCLSICSINDWLVDVYWAITWTCFGLSMLKTTTLNIGIQLVRPVSLQMMSSPLSKPKIDLKSSASVFHTAVIWGIENRGGYFPHRVPQQCSTEHQRCCTSPPFSWTSSPPGKRIYLLSLPFTASSPFKIPLHTAMPQHALGQPISLSASTSSYFRNSLQRYQQEMKH